MNMAIRNLIIAIALLLAAGEAGAQQEGSIFDEFLKAGEVVEIEIEAPLAELVENRRMEEAVQARFTYKNQRGQRQGYNIELSQRGKYRRRICGFPPLALNFSKQELRDEGLIAKYDKLKLVTHCLDDKEAGENIVLREYLAYKMYSELTPQSYRVQLARITYLDSGGEMNRIRRYGFIIEDTDEMAHRLGGSECEDCINPPDSAIEASAENLLSVFQYMISNTDWSLSMARNIKFVALAEGGRLIPVPFDFDFSGFVDASYALPNADYGQVSVKQRIFLGMPASRAVLEENLRFIIGKKERLLEMARECKLLNWEARAACQDFLNSFFLEAEQILSGTDRGGESPLLQQALGARPSGAVTPSQRTPGK